MSEFANEVKNEMKKRVLGLIRKPTAPIKKNTPKNMAPLALVGFNLVMTFLDLISSIAVAALTNWLYGVLTFVAGVGALYMWERLFTNAHGNMMQKWLSVGGGVLSVLSTLGIGILAAVVNGLDFAGVINVAGISTVAIDIGMIVSLVVIAFIHGIAWGVYYFADPTHIAEMKRMVSIAFREQQKQGIEDAKEDVKAVLEIAQEMEEYDKRGELEFLNASFETLRGRSLLADLPEDKTVNIDPEKPWVVKEQSIPSPLGGSADGKI